MKWSEIIYPTMNGKTNQAVYDAIKSVREGNTVNVTIDGETYQIEPWLHEEQNADGYCQLVLCKYHGRKIGVRQICWKDAGPNPRLLNGNGFIPRKNIYGLATKL
jgi:hypothetical protein